MKNKRINALEKRITYLEKKSDENRAKLYEMIRISEEVMLEFAKNNNITSPELARLQQEICQQ